MKLKIHKWCLWLLTISTSSAGGSWVSFSSSLPWTPGGPAVGSALQLPELHDTWVSTIIVPRSTLKRRSLWQLHIDRRSPGWPLPATWIRGSFSSLVPMQDVNNSDPCSKQQVFTMWRQQRYHHHQITQPSSRSAQKLWKSPYQTYPFSFFFLCFLNLLIFWRLMWAFRAVCDFTHCQV